VGCELVPCREGGSLAAKEEPSLDPINGALARREMRKRALGERREAEGLLLRINTLHGSLKISSASTHKRKR